jgi:hypothetical protein
MKNPLFCFFILTVILPGCSNSDIISTFENPAPPNSEFPHLYSTGDAVYMSWLSHHPDEKSYSLNFARYSGSDWNQTVQIAEDSTWFVNWADFPSVIANENSPIAAHWLDKIPGGTYAYNVNVSVRDKSAETWSQPFTPHFDSTATEHGFVSMIPWDSDTILAVWLDGRKTANRAEDEYFDIDKAMTLRGALISRSGKVKQKFLIDDSVCDCCPTSLAKTEHGAMVAYRNRTDDEIRDIFISRFDGSNWSEPKAIYNDNWEIAACPVNGPKLAVQDSLIALAWHTAADDKPVAKASLSLDGGSTFSEPVIINEEESLGRVDVTIHNGKAYVSWMEKDSTETYLKLTSFDANDGPSKYMTVSKINGSRRTGFPQMKVLDTNLIMAWTDIDQSPRRIKTVRVPLPISD